MKLIIDIDEKDFHRICQEYISFSDTLEGRGLSAIAEGTPIPDNATNGDVIKAMFDVKEIDMSNTYGVHFPEEGDYSHYFFKGWWNAPYQKGGKK